MAKRFCLLLSFVLFLGILSGCSSVQKAYLDSQFTLSPGQSAHITGESMDIKFIKVSEDSRCAKDVQCIWAGRVSCAIEITKDGIKNPITLSDTAGSGLSQGYVFQIYKIVFSVSPYPAKAGEKIANGDYRLTLTASNLPD
jgi:hypothetical protein